MDAFLRVHSPDSPEALEGLAPFKEQPYSTREVFLEWTLAGHVIDAVDLLRGPRIPKPLEAVDLPPRSDEPKNSVDPTE